MTTIDIIILIALGAGVIVGFMKGFIRQLASILGLIVGLLAAKALYTSLAVKLCPTVTDSMTVAADIGICHYLDRCAANLYIGGFSINQGIGGGFTWLAESHAWSRARSFEISFIGELGYLCHSVYRLR